MIYDSGQITLGPEMLHGRLAPGALQLSPNELLVFNGYDKGYINQVEIYDLTTQQWEDLGATTPAKSAYGTGAMIRDSSGEDVAIIAGEDKLALSPMMHHLSWGCT